MRLRRNKIELTYTTTKLIKALSNDSASPPTPTPSKRFGRSLSFVFCFAPPLCVVFVFVLFRVGFCARNVKLC
ncbi:ribosomal protein L33 [Candidatus Hodgkinia cicadicola]|nr:ribosomal protein L33 [Candidatus Hodgkinia cicadicola]